MPIGAAIGVAGVASAGAMMSASSKAAKSSQVATNAAVNNTDKTLASQEKMNADNIQAQKDAQQTAISAARDNTAKALSTVTGAQDSSLSDITAMENALRDKNTSVWEGLRSDASPYVAAGSDALSKLNNPNGSFAVSPEYNFDLSQGLNAVNTNKAVNGLLRSGSALKSVNDYAQGQASNEFTNWWNRQQQLVNTGMSGLGIDRSATAGLADTNANTTGTIANATQASANAKSNAATGGAFNLNSLIAGTSNELVSALGQDNFNGLNALGEANSSTNNALIGNANNQGNAALVTANGVSSGLGSIADLIAKYSGGSNASSYGAATSNGSIPWGDTVAPGYAGGVAA